MGGKTRLVCAITVCTANYHSLLLVSSRSSQAGVYNATFQMLSLMTSKVGLQCLPGSCNVYSGDPANYTDDRIAARSGGEA